MIPGQYRIQPGEIQLNEGRRSVALTVVHRGDRPIQVGSHYHFCETNRMLDFDREAAVGMRLDIPAGTAVRFEPGEEKPVRLVEYAGNQAVYGFYQLIGGPLSSFHPSELAKNIERWKENSGYGCH